MRISALVTWVCLWASGANAVTVVITTPAPKEYNGRWIASFPSQGACTFESKASFSVSDGFIAGIMQSPFGTQPFRGNVREDGNGAIQIGAFYGTIKFDHDNVDMDLANTCGPRRGKGGREPAN